jgi:hypothetical protein
MITQRFQSATRLLVATFALGAVALGFAAAPPTDAAGLRNCVDITGRHFERAGCYEDVWANDGQVRMTFSNLKFNGTTPRELDPFYVLAPQSLAPQGWPPNTFLHDHVVRYVPGETGGAYSTKLQGFFVLCSGQGIVSGECEPLWTSLGGPQPLPLAQAVDGYALTSAEAIEAAADAGLLVLWNLGPDAIFVGTVSGK